MYQVITYEVKSGFFGANTEKTDKQMEEFLNKQESLGWHLVSMTEMNTNSKSWNYKMIFKKA